jgi:ABC-type siderophore export system fused ATPase/permease subunit
MAALVRCGFASFLVGTGILATLNHMAPLPNRADSFVLPTLIGVVLFLGGQVALACWGIMCMVRNLGDGD